MLKLHRFSLCVPTHGLTLHRYIFSYNNKILFFSDVEADDVDEADDELVQRKFLRMLEQGKITPQGILKFLPGVEPTEIKLDDYTVKQSAIKLRLNELEKDFEKETKDA